MPKRKYASDKERITRNVAVDDKGCWIWQGYVHPNTGYGSIYFDGESTVAHRVAYRLFVGPIPTGLHIDHLCRVRACANPEHLEPVTVLENVRRAPVHIAHVNRAKTHCVNGHEYTPENTGRSGKYQYRYCIACNRAAARRSYERRVLAAANVNTAGVAA